MCKSNCYKFSGCGHWVIRCYSPCARVLWEAGHNERLQWCTPEILSRSLEWEGDEHFESPKPVVFLGVTGSCEYCRNYYQLPNQIHEFVPAEDCLLIHGPQNPFIPQGAAPLFETVRICATIPELMGFHDQLSRELGNLGPKIHFTSIWRATHWSELRDLQIGSLGERICDIKGEWLGASNYILSLQGCNWGLTAAERHSISMAIQDSKDPQGLYSPFEKRGMPLEHYQMCVAKIREDLEKNGPEKLAPSLMSRSTCEAASSSKNNSGLPSTPSPKRAPQPREASVAASESPSSGSEDSVGTQEPASSNASPLREDPVIAPEEMSEDQLTAHLLSLDNIQSYHHYLAWKAGQQQQYLDDPFVDSSAGHNAEASKRPAEKAPMPQDSRELKRKRSDPEQGLRATSSQSLQETCYVTPEPQCPGPSHMPNTTTASGPSSASLLPAGLAPGAQGNASGGPSAPRLREAPPPPDAKRLQAVAQAALAHAALAHPAQPPRALAYPFVWERPKERFGSPFPWDFLTPTFVRCMAWLPERKQVIGESTLDMHWRVIRRAKAGDMRIGDDELKTAKQKVAEQSRYVLFAAFENEGKAWEEAHPGQIVDEMWTPVWRGTPCLDLPYPPRQA